MGNYFLKHSNQGLLEIQHPCFCGLLFCRYLVLALSVSLACASWTLLILQQALAWNNPRLYSSPFCVFPSNHLTVSTSRKKFGGLPINHRGKVQVQRWWAGWYQITESTSLSRLALKRSHLEGELGRRDCHRAHPSLALHKVGDCRVAVAFHSECHWDNSFHQYYSCTQDSPWDEVSRTRSSFPKLEESLWDNL